MLHALKKGLPEEKIHTLLRRFDQGIQLTFKSTEKEILRLYHQSQQGTATFNFRSLLMSCEKPKLFGGSNYEEPCSSPALTGCSCHLGATEGEEQS